jgi:hypothetical protein
MYKWKIALTLALLIKSDDFEKKMKSEIPLIEKITTHIETESSEHVAIRTEKKINQPYLEKIRNIDLSFNRVIDCSAT